jgi:hypothetical protein
MRRASRYAYTRNSDNPTDCTTDERTYPANLTATHGSTDIFTNRCSVSESKR